MIAPLTLRSAGWFSAWQHVRKEVRGWLFARKLDYLIDVRKQTPVLIYQMGKVGSKSVFSSFPTRKHPFAVHLHRLHDRLIHEKISQLRAANLPAAEHYFHGKAVYRRVIKRHRPFKMITLVREPISRNMSFFFEKFKDVVGVPFSQSRHSVRELCDVFMRHEDELNRSAWFENEFEPALGIDIYERPFPKELGHLRIACGNGEILLVKLELDDGAKEECIAEFLDDRDFRLSSANVGAAKEYSSTYQEFLATIELPEYYIDRMLDSRYTRHFYSESEIEAIRTHWRSRRTN